MTERLSFSRRVAVTHFTRLNTMLAHATLFLIAILFGLMVTLLFTQVVGRYVFGYAPVWVTETSQYLFLWVSFLGVAVGVRRYAHVSLDYLWTRSPEPLRSIQLTVVHIAMICVAGVIAFGGYGLVSNFANTYTPGMQISMAWVYSPPLVSGLLTILFGIEQLIAQFMHSADNNND